MKDKTVTVHVGTPEDMGRRFTDAWHRAEAGAVTTEEHVTFLDLESLLGALTGKRLEMLHHLHRRPASSVAALARELHRDYKRVHEDINALATIGLVAKDGEIRATCDEIRATLRL